MNEQRLLNHRYVLGEILGRGGMATVCRAHDLRLNRDVAIKQLRIDLASDTTFQERFRREAHAAAGLNHPNIVAVYDTGEDTDAATGVSVPYIVMELVEGRTLRDILRDGRPVLPHKALEFTVGVLDALAFSHRAGIVHRDIKPANVMITDGGTVKVMDFGIARAVADTSSTMTQTAAVIGTAQYLSPEQARGETVDARSDLYSAGCLLYELLVGKPPFTGDSPVSVAYQHVRELPTPPSQLDTEITPEMDTVVLKALAKDPDDRYQTAEEMNADLQRLLAGQAVHAVLAPAPPTRVDSDLAGATAVLDVYPTQPESPAEPAQPERRKRRWVWPLVAVLLLVIGGGVFAMTQLMPQGSQVMVPNVVSLEQSLAETTLRDKNLVPQVNQVPGPDDGTVGQVTAQTPVPNTRVPVQTTVTLTVNVGPEKLKIPTGLLNQDVNDVHAQLTKLGFTNINTVPATNEPARAAANQVLGVDPGEGSQIPAGQQITLTFATGKARVPNLALMNRTDAEAEARNAGFTSLNWIPQASTSEEGLVTGTDPAAGTKANKADPLTIYVAVPPATTPIETPEPENTGRPSTPSVRPTATPTG